MAQTSLPLWKTTQVARTLGLSVSTVKRLIDDGLISAARTGGKHRLVSPQEVQRYASEHGLFVAPISQTDLELKESGSESACPGDLDLDQVDLLADALRSGSEADVHAIFNDRLASVEDVVQLADELIRPALAVLGEEWRAGKLDIFQEHRASRILEGALLTRNRELAERNRATGARFAPLAMGCAPENHPYTIAGLLCELVLRSAGWDVMNLGANLPLSSLGRAVELYRPRIVWISVSNLEDSARFVKDYQDFHTLASRLFIPIVLGGQALQPELLEQIRYSQLCERMATFVDFFRLFQPSGAEASL